MTMIDSRYLAYRTDRGVNLQPTFTPATAGQLAQLAAETPEQVTAVAARMLTAHNQLTCDPNGCEAGTHTWTWEQIAGGDAGQYTDLHTGWGIRTPRRTDCA